MTLPTHARPPECAAFEEAVQRVLDRELDASALDGPHPAGCAECRGLVVAARLLLAPRTRPTPPNYLAQRIADEAAFDFQARRFRLKVTRYAVAGLAACLMVGTVVLLDQMNRSGPVPHVKLPAPMPPEAPPPRVADTMADAGSALASITRKATDQAVTPTRNLFPMGDLELPMSDLPPEVEPAAESLAQVPHAASAGLGPVTGTTRRAVNLFLRDVGLASAEKPDS